MSVTTERASRSGLHEEHRRCLLCGDLNPQGLGLRFEPDSSGGVAAVFTGGPHLQGYDGILHGGVIASLLDSAMTHGLFRHGVRPMTGDLRVRFLKPVPCNATVVLRARVRESMPPLFRVEAELILNREVMAKAEGKFMHQAKQTKTSRVRLTFLVENHAEPPLTAEHGLSVLIETDQARILFDTGQGPALPENCRALGIDLSGLDAVVLSHGHYDHTGGLPYALSQADTARLFCHPGVMIDRYAIKPGEAARAIHMPAVSRRAVEQLDPDRISWVTGPIEICSGIHLTGPIPRRTAYEDTGGPFFLDPQGCRPDPIEDDQALWIETHDRLVVVLGCAHAGVVNTLERITELSGRKEIVAVIGGMHLGQASNNRLEATVEALRACHPDVLAPCHCTGEMGMAWMRDHLGPRVRRFSTGLKIVLPCDDA